MARRAVGWVTLVFVLALLPDPAALARGPGVRRPRPKHAATRPARPAPVVPAEEAIARARASYQAGRAEEALGVLRAARRDHPHDGDVATLLGTMLSWQGRYGEGRAVLEAVLARTPGHGDALPALVRIELWDGKLERADTLAREGLALRPRDSSLLVLHARVLEKLGRDTDALRDLAAVPAKSADATEASELRERILDRHRVWTVRLGYSVDVLVEDDDHWDEHHLALARPTPIGKVIGHVYHAQRFDLDDELFELEAYPRIRPGTYAFVSIAGSPGARLYPHYRVAADLYQSLPWSFELSGGFRRLVFDDAVHIYTGYLAKYAGNWMFFARTYVTPSDAGLGKSFHYAVRRYFGTEDRWIGLRFGHGASPAEVRTAQDAQILDSMSLTAEIEWPLSTRWGISFSAGASREDRVHRSALTRIPLGLTLGYRF